MGYLEIAVYYTSYPNSPDSMADVTDGQVHRCYAGQCDVYRHPAWASPLVIKLKRAACPLWSNPFSGGEVYSPFGESTEHMRWRNTAEFRSI